MATSMSRRMAALTHGQQATRGFHYPSSTDSRACLRSGDERRHRNRKSLANDSWNKDLLGVYLFSYHRLLTRRNRPALVSIASLLVTASTTDQLGSVLSNGRSSSRRLDPGSRRNSWLIGNKLLLSRAARSQCTWGDGNGGGYTISDTPLPLPECRPLSGTSGIKLVHDAGDVAAVFSIGDAFCKIRIMDVPDVTREHVTLGMAPPTDLELCSS